jgi:hypothetical protein
MTNKALKSNDQQSIEKQIKGTQSGYMRNQKKTHGYCLGASSGKKAPVLPAEVAGSATRW